MRIRPACFEDAPALARHIAMAESEMIRFFTGANDPEVATAALEPWIRSSTPCRFSAEFGLLAEVDGQTAGSAISFPADRQPELDGILLEALHHRGFSIPRLSFEGEPGTYYLYAMGVDPAFRGRGIGSALMAASEDRARQLGFSRTSLLVAKDKEKMWARYERQGYSVVADISIGGVAYRRMARTL